jgi:hypothetical protein
MSHTMADTIPFTPDAVLKHIDGCIRACRVNRDEAARTGDTHGAHTWACYVDAYQSIRCSLFGSTLPVEE